MAMIKDDKGLEMSLVRVGVCRIYLWREIQKQQQQRRRRQQQRQQQQQQHLQQRQHHLLLACIFLLLLLPLPTTIAAAAAAAFTATTVDTIPRWCVELDNLPLPDGRDQSPGGPLQELKSSLSYVLQAFQTYQRSQKQGGPLGPCRCHKANSSHFSKSTDIQKS